MRLRVTVEPAVSTSPQVTHRVVKGSQQRLGCSSGISWMSVCSAAVAENLKLKTTTPNAKFNPTPYRP